MSPTNNLAFSQYSCSASCYIIRLQQVQRSELGGHFVSRSFHDVIAELFNCYSYLLATCTFTPLYGRLSDVMGRRRANELAIFFAAVGILACGLSNSMQMLIISRFVSPSPSSVPQI